MSTEKDKDQLARDAMPRLNSIVRNMVRRLGYNVEEEELRSYAMVGLADAIDRFDPTLEIPIDRYAAKRIQGAIYDGIYKNQFLPRRLIRQVSFLRASEEMMRYEKENPPPQDKVEVVHRLANRLKDLACAYVTTCTATTEQQGESDEALNAETVAEKKQYYEKIKIVMKTLPDPQSVVVHRFFFEEARLTEIADDYGKSKSWASRQLQAALHNMRRQFDDP